MLVYPLEIEHGDSESVRWYKSEYNRLTLLLYKVVDFGNYQYAIEGDLEKNVPGFKEWWAEHKNLQENINERIKQSALYKLSKAGFTDEERIVLGLKDKYEP